MSSWSCFLVWVLANFSTVLNLNKSSNKIKIYRVFNFLDLLKLCYFISAYLTEFFPSSPNSFYSKKVFENLLRVWIRVLIFSTIIIVDFLWVYWISLYFWLIKLLHNDFAAWPGFIWQGSSSPLPKTLKMKLKYAKLLKYYACDFLCTSDSAKCHRHHGWYQR